MKVKKMLSLLISVVVLLSALPMSISADEADVYQVIRDGIGSAEKYLQEQIEDLSESGAMGYEFEWYVTTMLRGGKTIAEETLAQYYAAVEQEIKQWNADVKPTDAARVALALTIMEKDIADVDGVNVAGLIYNSARLTEGSNELAYALIALDAAEIEIPQEAAVTRESMITELLKFQTESGGFGLRDNKTAEVDITAMCLQALSRYQKNETVKIATEQAISYLEKMISEDYHYSDNPNSTAQVLLALSSLKIDITDPSRGFGTSEKNIITALSRYRNTDGNGYLYSGEVNPMTTVQIMQAYDAYRKAGKEDLLYWDFGTEGTVYDDQVADDDKTEEEMPETGACDDATVYVTIASEGQIVKDKDRNDMAQAAVTVTDLDENGVLSVHEALYAAHEMYYEGGAEAGYRSYQSAHGLSLSVLWGKGTAGTAAAAGYWLNNASCWSLESEVKEGDFLTAFNYYDAEYWSDAYAYFSENEATVTRGSSLVLTLQYMGYDADWNPVPLPCAGAKVAFLGSNNSSQKFLKTDEDGKVTIDFSDSFGVGNYYLVAYADDGSLVPAVCKIKVEAEEGGGSGVGSLTRIRVSVKVSDPKGKTYLKKTSYLIEKNTSAYEVLMNTGLDVEVAKGAYGVYVKAIEGLSEFAEGAESGWMYRVNGVFPACSASLYNLEDGDRVEWLYTRNYGEDLKEKSYSSSSGGRGTMMLPYTVKFETNGGTSVNEQNVAGNQTVAMPKTPEKEGYAFVGWYKDKNLTERYDFSDKVKGNMTLYAKWKEKETEPNPSEPPKSFADVKTDSWYADAIAFATEKNLFQGVSETEFAPDAEMTRAMLVTVLYRLENPEAREYPLCFVDVVEEEWYTDAIAWAAETGVVNGISETVFAPDDSITREQLAAILYRYAGIKGCRTEATSDLSGLTDGKEISEWALEAINWAHAEGLLKGVKEGILAPQATATRAQVATMIMRFYEIMV